MSEGGGEASYNSASLFLFLLEYFVKRRRTHSAQKKKKMERKGKKKVAEKSERWSTKIKKTYFRPPLKSNTSTMATFSQSKKVHPCAPRNSFVPEFGLYNVAPVCGTKVPYRLSDI
jgi:hypothetical protein